MEVLGALAILFAFCLSIYAFVGSIVGIVWKRPYLQKSAERAVLGVFALVSIASGILVFFLTTSDFRLAYVAAHSNRAMPVMYKFASWWGGQEGSLLLWSWLLSVYSAVVVWTNRRRHTGMMPWVIATLQFTQIFFLVLNAFVEPPFKVLAVGRGIQAMGDGQGLNPLLQYWMMAIHPPMLYLGYVGFIVPFAFAMGSLVTKQKGDAWIHTTRRWSLITWGFQTTGVILGAGWAYAVLGWGGYWGWDPVENASLLPWITATAFLHSVMMQEKKGMMKVWNMVLVSTTYFLCIFGTFLTRSGFVSSVHAFAESSIGFWFLGFLGIGISATVILIFSRLDYLKSETKLESVLSRESSFLFNNLLLLASAFAVLWGTVFPRISEMVTGEKITVGAPFFNKVNVPIGLFLLLLTGVGPLIAWRRSSWDSLKKAFRWPTIFMVVTIVVLAVAGISHFYALMSFGLCVFVATTITMEFWKGARAIAARTKANLVMAAVELTHRNTRRYGGYLVHMGIVLMFAGFTGAAFNKDTTQEVKVGDRLTVGHYELLVEGITDGSNDNFTWQRATIAAFRDGKALGELTPERRVYVMSQQPTSIVAIRRRLNEDLYLNFAGMSETEAGHAILQVYVNPLVSCIWLGFWVVFSGTLICLVPSKVKLAYARTEVVGVYEKKTTASK